MHYIKSENMKMYLVFISHYENPAVIPLASSYGNRYDIKSEKFSGPRKNTALSSMLYEV